MLISVLWVAALVGGPFLFKLALHRALKSAIACSRLAAKPVRSRAFCPVHAVIVQNQRRSSGAACVHIMRPIC